VGQKSPEHPQGLAMSLAESDRAARYPDDIRNVIRKAVKNRKVIPHDQAAMKDVCLAVNAAAKIWAIPLCNWKRALSRL
jgi:transposase-like protein